MKTEQSVLNQVEQIKQINSQEFFRKNIQEKTDDIIGNLQKSALDMVMPVYRRVCAAYRNKEIKYPQYLHMTSIIGTKTLELTGYSPKEILCYFPDQNFGINLKENYEDFLTISIEDQHMMADQTVDFDILPEGSIVRAVHVRDATLEVVKTRVEMLDDNGNKKDEQDLGFAVKGLKLSHKGRVFLWSGRELFILMGQTYAQVRKFDNDIVDISFFPNDKMVIAQSGGMYSIITDEGSGRETGFLPFREEIKQVQTVEDERFGDPSFIVSGSFPGFYSKEGRVMGLHLFPHRPVEGVDKNYRVDRFARVIEGGFIIADNTNSLRYSKDGRDHFLSRKLLLNKTPSSLQVFGKDQVIIEGERQSPLLVTDEQGYHSITNFMDLNTKSKFLPDGRMVHLTRGKKFEIRDERK